MARPIVIAHHLVWTAYGWWLPNDPRGSHSHTIRNNVIADLGRLHNGRKRIQPASADIRAFYEQAEQALQHELLCFGPDEIALVAESFQGTVARERYTCYACAIMPDHVHILIRKHKHQAEEMISHLQNDSRLRLREAGARTPVHPVWGGPGWKVFLDHPDDIWRTSRYIDGNPAKLRMPPQHWPFVVEYNNWPLHPGHSPNSPYVKRMRNP